MATTDVIDPALEAAASLPRELAVLKMENDQIFALATARPRDFGKVRTELADMIESFPQFADDAIYEKPVGKGDDGKMKFARGLSVRAAECLAECYGYNRIHTDVESLPDGRVKIYASFTDYQRGRTWEDATIVSPYYKGRNGQTQRHPEDRFLNVIVKSEKSKLVREVINRSVNQALKAWFEGACENKLAQTLDDKAVAKIIDGFKAFNLSPEQVEQIVGRPRSMGWTQQDRVRLLGVFNALKAGETKVEELLAEPVQEPGKTPTTTGTVDGLNNPKGKTEPPRGEKQPEKTNHSESPNSSTAEPSRFDKHAARIAKAKSLDDVSECNANIATDDDLDTDERTKLFVLLKAKNDELSPKK